MKRISSFSLFGAFAFVAAVPAFASPGPDFIDVPSWHPNYDAIMYVQEQSIVEGYADDTYRPDQPINRAEFTKILVAAEDHSGDNGPGIAEGYQDQDQGVFTDVHREWFASYVFVAKYLGWVGGYPDGSFRPAANINFVEAAKIISIALWGASPGPQEPLEGQPWYRGFVEILESDNVIPLSITSLDQNITRGEMAEMIYRLKANVAAKPSRTYAELEPKMMSVFVYLYNGADESVPCVTGYDCDHLYEASEILVPHNKAVLKASVQALLDMGEDSGCDGSGSLCTDWYLSDLTVTYATIVDGVAHVKIEGDVMLAGTMSGVRAIQEITRTVMQFPSVKSADITVNGKPLYCIADESGIGLCY